MIFGNHDYAVSDFQMILSVWNNDLPLTSDTGDQIIRLGRQVFKRNIGELAFLLNNKLYCLHLSAQQPVHRLHICAAVRIIPGSYITHDRICRFPRNIHINPGFILIRKQFRLLQPYPTPILHLVQIPKHRSRTIQRTEFGSAVRSFVKRFQIIICLEAINRYETALLNSAEATVEFIDNGLGNPDCVGILWDLFHANIEDIGYERSIKIMGNKLKHIHLADSNRMFPGYGHTDIAAILKMVKNTGYSEYASFECFNLPSLETVLNETGAWVQKMREL